jgi:hypothetical protein
MNGGSESSVVPTDRGSRAGNAAREAANGRER